MLTTDVKRGRPTVREISFSVRDHVVPSPKLVGELILENPAATDTTRSPASGLEARREAVQDIRERSPLYSVGSTSGRFQ
jgi:hypothetical protein